VDSMNCFSRMRSGRRRTLAAIGVATRQCLARNSSALAGTFSNSVVNPLAQARLSFRQPLRSSSCRRRSVQRRPACSGGTFRDPGSSTARPDSPRCRRGQRRTCGPAARRPAGRATTPGG
jgi:hypothetical protein